MLSFLKELTGPVNLNGVTYESIQAAADALAALNYKGKITVQLVPNQAAQAHNRASTQACETAASKLAEAHTDSGTVYKIKVRQYMTKPSTVDFQFHKKFNKDVPMPMRIMVGRKLEETNGMVKMELWAQITEELTHVCMKCGRALTNNVSKYFGIGPECGGHNYTHPFETDEQLRAAVEQHNEVLKQTKWTGWIIKSAIESEEVI